MRARQIASWALACVAVVTAPAVGILITAKRNYVAFANDAEAPPKSVGISTPEEHVAVILAPNMATVSAQTEGRVLRVNVVLGQRVHAGQKLLALDARAAEKEVDVARAQLKAAQGALAAAQADYARLKQQVFVREGNPGLVSGEELANVRKERDAAGGRVVAAAGQVDVQKARVEQARLALEVAAPDAPFDGYVTELAAREGATVHRGDSLVRLVGGTGLRARIAIPAHAAGVWRDHRRARLQLADGRVLWSFVEHVPAELDAVTRTYNVEGAVVIDPSRCEGPCELLGGQMATATLLSDRE